MSGNADQLVQLTLVTLGGVDILKGLNDFAYTVTVDTVVNKGDDDVFGHEELVVNGEMEWNFSGINQELADLVPAGTKGILIVQGTRVSDGGTGIITIGKATVKSEGPTIGSRETGQIALSGSAMSSDGVTHPVVWSTSP